MPHVGRPDVVDFSNLSNNRLPEWRTPSSIAPCFPHRGVCRPRNDLHGVRVDLTVDIKTKLGTRLHGDQVQKVFHRPAADAFICEQVEDNESGSDKRFYISTRQVKNPRSDRLLC